MRPVSRKRDAQVRVYRKRRAVWLVGKVCARCGQGHIPGVFELSIQHLKGRDGDLLLDENFWLPLCWEPCHRLATDNPTWALENGYALPRVGAA